MWDWLGGRTSELSFVGVLPAPLQRLDIQRILYGPKAWDEITRRRHVRMNPAAQLALAWHHAGGDTGLRSMIVIPYKNRLEFLSRYLQQLILESTGKELDRSGTLVNQGIGGFGDKESTHQNAYLYSTA